MKRRRQEVSDVSDIDQITKVFLARSIPIDGRVCLCPMRMHKHITRWICNFSIRKLLSVSAQQKKTETTLVSTVWRQTQNIEFYRNLK